MFLSSAYPPAPVQTATAPASRLSGQFSQEARESEQQQPQQLYGFFILKRQYVVYAGLWNTPAARAGSMETEDFAGALHSSSAIRKKHADSVKTNLKLFSGLLFSVKAFAQKLSSTGQAGAAPSPGTAATE